MSCAISVASEPRLRASVVVAGIARAAERARTGDFHGALTAAMHALDDAPVPIMHASPTYLSKARLTCVQRMLVPLVDGRTSLEEIIDAAGLALLEGLEAFAGLLDAGLVGIEQAPQSVSATLRSAGEIFFGPT